MMSEEQDFTPVSGIATHFVTLRATAIVHLESALSFVPSRSDGSWGATHAIYALVRATLESAGLAMWLIEPSKRHERIHRALRLGFQSAQGGSGLVELTMAAEVITEEKSRSAQRHADLNRFKDQLGALRQLTLKPPPAISKVLDSLSPLRGPATGQVNLASPLAVWKMCSGLLHGDSRVHSFVTRPRANIDRRFAIIPDHSQPREDMLAMSIAECIYLLESMDERYSWLGTHDYAGVALATADTPYDGSEPGASAADWRNGTGNAK